MIIRKMLRFLFLSACFSGCLYQILYVNNQYFSYKTTTRVNSNLQDIVSYPTIVFCTRISDMIDRHNFDLLRNSQLSLFNLTIKQLLTLTPAENEIIDGCQFRDDSQHRYIFKYYNSSYCYNHFGVKKIIVGDLVCYQIYTYEAKNYSIYRVANAISYGMYVFNIYLTTPFTRAIDLIIPAFYNPTFHQDVSIRATFPTYSRHFAEVITRHQDENWIIMKPFAEHYHLLPCPYDTNCTLINKCYRKCVTEQTVSLLNLHPFSEPATAAHSNLKLLSSIQLKDLNVLRTWQEIKSKCDFLCLQLECTITISSNLAYEYRYWTPKNMTLTVSVPGMYFKTITSVPALSFIEYISSMTTCISIWFGFSALSVNPFNWLIRTKIISTKLKLHFKWFKMGGCIYYAICLVGFIFQLSSVCNQFFKFETSSRIKVSTEDQYKYQAITICFNHKDIMNRTEYRKYNISKTFQEAFLQGDDELSNLTVEQLFTLTPKAEDVIQGCGLRDELNYRLKRLHAKECMKFFSIMKAVRGEWMCYAFVPQKNATFSWTKVATSHTGKGRVYHISVNLSVELQTTMAVISYQTLHSGLPTLSRSFAQLVSLQTSNFVIVASMLNIFQSLPPPYDTKCATGPDNQDQCASKCLVQELRSQLNRAPFSIYLVNQSLNLRPVSSKDLKNKTFSDLLFDIQGTCRSRCSFLPCLQLVSFTDSSDYYNFKDKGSLRIISMVPKRPALVITSIPATTLTDFLLYICNCFGIWFGLSFVTCDPIFIWLQILELRKRIRILLQTSNFLPVGKGFNHPSIFRFFMLSICVCGCTFQCYMFCDTYFKYKTSSRIEITARETYRLPDIILCTRYREVTSKKVWESYSTQLMQQENEPTIRQILQMTPNNTLDECGYRFNGSDEFQMKKEIECSKIWKIVKYASGADVCYAYLSAENEAYSIPDVASALDHVGIIYELYLNESMKNAQHLYLISDTNPLGLSLTLKATLPVRSRKYGEAMIRGLDDKTLNYFTVQGTIYNVTLLQAPYDTGCVPDYQADFCGPDCNTKYKQEQLQRVPFHEIITEPLDLRMVSEKDLMNETVQEIIKKGNEMCSKKCSHPPCQSYYSLTDAFGNFKADIGLHRLVLAAGVPRSNGLIVNTFPSMQLIDFLNNLAVSASIWFGVSVLSLFMIPLNFKFMDVNKNNLKSRRVHTKQRLERIHGHIQVYPRSYCQCSYCQRFYFIISQKYNV